MNVQMEATLSAGCTPGEAEREGKSEKDEKGAERAVR